MSNAVEVQSTGQVLVQEVAQHVIELTAPATPVTVEIITEGPQGPSSPGGSGTLAGCSDVDVTAKVDKSVLYYDAGASKWKGDALETKISLTDGGSF